MRSYRRQQWFGTKPVVKKALSTRPVHVVMRTIAPWLSRYVRYQRLPAPRQLRSVQAVMGGVWFEMLAPDRCVVAKELYWGRGRRPGAADQRALEVFALLVPQADLVLDIGAYTGIFSLLAAKRSVLAEVHAFEIVPEVAELLRENIARNRLESRIQLHTHGVGREGVAWIPAAIGGSALPDFFSVDMQVVAGRSVPVRRLDGLDFLTTRWDRSGVLVKVDVEGAEREVLEGASSFIDRNRPDVLCELLPGSRSIADLPCLQGYHFYLVEDGYLSEHAKPFGDARYRDWLFSMKPAPELRRLSVPVVGV